MTIWRLYPSWPSHTFMQSYDFMRFTFLWREYFRKAHWQKDWLTASPLPPAVPWGPGKPLSPFSPCSPGGPIRPIRPGWPWSRRRTKIMKNKRNGIHSESEIFVLIIHWTKRNGKINISFISSSFIICRTWRQFVKQKRNEGLCTLCTYK